MRVMYVCGMYVPSHGGAEISMYSLLKKSQEKFGWNILAITDERYGKTKNFEKFNEIQLQTIPHNNREAEIEKTILDFKPDIILTQLMWSDVVLKLADKHSIPSVMRVCKVPIELDLAKGSKYAPTAIISTSNFVKEYVLNHWNRGSNIVKPLVEIEDYLIEKEEFNPSENNLIFMFNPLQRKGGLIFKEIAKRLPSEKFGTVYGWSSLKENKNSNNFSGEYIKRITESEGSTFDGSLPEYVNFDNCDNLTVFTPEDDPRELYEKMKILLIPSQWDEAFGRVAIEAMVNGIPVIASDVAGLKDSVGDGGILVKKDDVIMWVEEIQKLLSDKDYFQEISKREIEFVKNSYNEDNILNDFKEIIENTIKQDKN